jgi:secreted PhoX family phosphatase
MNRRTFLRTSAAVAGAATFAPQFWHAAVAAGPEPRVGDGPYGPLGPPNADGLRLPDGFTGRIVARSGQPVGGAGAYAPYDWHIFPDGGATFSTPDGGWVYVSNSEITPDAGGGVSAIRFDQQGAIAGAYRILSGTSINCAGGPTPWGTWLSCEEWPEGQVWECDPQQPSQGIARAGLGRFRHEAAAVDPVRKRVYLTEDAGDGRFYRFTPTRWPDLSAGVLQAAVVGPKPVWRVQWVDVDASVPQGTNRLPETTAFAGGEGCWYDRGDVYFTTKSDHRVYRYDIRAARLRVIYDPVRFEEIGLIPPLTNVDNVTVARSGDVIVAEDPGDLQLVMITPHRVVAPLLQLVGQQGSELAGPAFDPSGTRLYFSSQRGEGLGITYEVIGPFRRTAG